MTEDELISALAQKDADFLEKVVGKILNLATSYWMKKTNDAYKRGVDGQEEYYASFQEWLKLRLHEMAVADEIASKLDRNQDSM